MAYLWEFHVHHIIPEEAYTNQFLKQALEAAGFFQQAKGNKIALFASSETAAAVRQSINNGNSFYLDAGFGGSVHPGRESGLSHKGYSDFALDRLNDIMLLQPTSRQAAFTKLHAFLSDVSEGRLANLGVESSFAAFNGVWGNYDPSTAELNQHAADFDPTVTDADGLSNAEERYDRVKDLIKEAHDSGHLSDVQYNHYLDRLEVGASKGPSHVSGVGVSAIIDIQKSMSAAPVGAKTEIGGLVARWVSDQEGPVPIDVFDRMMSSIDGLDNVTDAFGRGRMPASLSELGGPTVDAMSLSMSNMVGRLGGGPIGDIVEFMNVSYESFKHGVDTGDWTGFEQNVALYGFSLVASATVMTLSVIAVGWISAGAAPYVAGAWAIYGLFDAVTNGLELIGKLYADWRESDLGKLFDEFFDLPPLSPLVLDLDGDGLELISLENSSTYFDLDADGIAELTGWVGPDDALLAIDLDNDGLIDNGSELFGDQTGFAHGFLALAEHDSNNDGVIDAQDAAFSDLLLWRDANGDGISQANELKTIADLDIASISISATATNQQVQGHDVLWQAGFSRDDGSTGTVSDVFFQVDSFRTKAVVPDGFVFDPDVFKLPVIQGAGHLPSTLIALSADPALKAQFAALLAQAAAGDITGFLAGFEDFAYAWAGVASIAPTSRGPAMDARKVAFLEAILDRSYQQDDEAYFGNPGPVAALMLDWEASEIFEAMAAQFLAQSTVSNAQLTATSASTYEAAILGHPLRALPSVGSGDDSYEWVEEILADAAEGTGFTLAQAEALLRVMRHEANDLGAYEQAIAHGYAAIGIDAGVAQQTAARIVAEHGYYVTDGPGDELVPDGITADHAVYVSDPQGNETLEGGEGDDVLVGREGDDTYVWGTGMGNDVTDEEGDADPDNATEVDRLVLANLTANDVRFVRMTEPGFDLDLMIEIVSTGEWLLLDDQLSSYAFEAIEEIEFSDGQVMSDVEFEQLARFWFDGTAGNDNIVGTASADIIRGGGGNDTLKGGDGNDSYHYARGDGADTVTEVIEPGSLDKLILENIAPGDVSLVRSGNDVTLVIAESAPGAGDGGSILLKENLNDNNSRGIDRIEFPDGTIWTRATLRLALIAQSSTSGNDNIVGFTSADTIRGGTGNDTLSGDDGGDTYYYARGDGADTITEVIEPTSLDKLILENIAPGDVSLARSGNDVTLVIAESAPGAGDGGSILLKENLNDNNSRGIDRIEFPDGTIWTRATLRLALIAQSSTSGNDNIVGFTSADTIRGGTGNDTLSGGNGGDTYYYARGDGADTITEVIEPGSLDKLMLEGILPTEVSAVRSGNDVTLVIAESAPGAGDGGSILLKENLVDNNSRGIDQIVFSDGTVWTRATLRSLVLLGGSGNDTITGYDSNDYLSGGDGNDTLDGGAGTDVIHGGVGNDIIRGGVGDDTHVGGDGDDLMYGSSGADSFDGGDGNDTLNFDYTSTALSADLAAGSVTFATGEIESAIDIENFISGAGNDTLLGSAQGNNLRGGAGNDIINGGDGDDVIDGGEGNDSQFGGNGDDLLIAGLGTDTFDGGDGVDTIDTTYYASNVQVDLTAGTLTFANGVIESAVNIENATTAAGNDVLVGTSGNNRLNSGDGNDTLHGGDGDDVLDGGAGLDSYFGGAGDDLLIGNMGTDSFDGGDGNDTLDLTYATESITADLTAGTVLFSGGTNESAINIENLKGGTGNDTILGTNGSNVLTGGLGSDQLDGGLGADAAIYNGARDDYSIVENLDGSFTITDLDTSNGDEGTDVLTSIELARFADQDVTLAVEPIHQVINGMLSIPVDSAAGGQIQLALPPGYAGVFDYTIIDNAAHGSVSIDSDGNYSYASATGYIGEDSFSVRIEDEFGGVRVATVSVSVRDPNAQSPISFVNGFWRTNNKTTDTDYWRMEPAASALEGGGYVVVWSQDGRDGSLSGVMARRYDIDGNAVGSEFQVNTYTTNDQSLADVAGLSGGGFVVTWTSTSQDGSGDGVYAQRYTSTGAKLGSEFRANTTTADYQRRSTVAATDDGGFIVTWESNSQDGSDFGVYFRKYNSSGTAVTAEIRANTYTTDWQRAPQIQELADGKFVVVWDSSTQDGSGLGAYGQVFNADGSKFGSEFQVHDYTPNAQREPDIAALEDGGFVVVWEDESEGFGVGSGADIVGRLFGADGVSAGPSFRINGVNTAGNQAAPQVAALPDGGFFVVWGDLSDGTIRGQRFDSLGQAEGSEIIVADYAISEAWRPVVSVLEDGGIALAWQFSDTSGGRTSIRTTLLLGDHIGTISGTEGADTIVGDDIRNTFYGGGGEDRLDGGVGDDWLTGGAGSDTFIFRGDFGNDVVEDFEIHASGENGDVIEINDHADLVFADIVANAEQWGADAHLDLGDGNSITLRGVAVSELTSQDFRFA